jgi:hypothetical protein
LEEDKLKRDHLFEEIDKARKTKYLQILEFLQKGGVMMIFSTDYAFNGAYFKAVAEE